MKEPVGHDAVRRTLRLLAERSAAGGDAALHHAWLFAGPPGVGKFRVARWWAALLRCPQVGKCAPACESCRLVAAEVHPDIFEMGPAPKDKDEVGVSIDKDVDRKRIVSVDQSRELIQRLSLRPLRPGPRIGIVRGADLMNMEAQNALLKLLEEPPGFAVIILVADNVGAMLATVRSRCRHLMFGSLSADEVRDVLVELGREPGEAAAAAAVAHGSAARALELDADGLAERERLLVAFEAARGDALAVEPLVTLLVQNKDRGYALTDILEWQIARIEAALGRRTAEPSPALSRLLDESANANVRTLVEEAERIQRTIDAIDRNANAKLVIRDMLMNVRASAAA